MIWCHARDTCEEIGPDLMLAVVLGRIDASRFFVLGLVVSVASQQFFCPLRRRASLHDVSA